MAPERYVEALAADAESMAAAAGRNPDAAVRACPGWLVTRLVGHTGRLHRWVTEMVRTGATARIDRAQMPAAPEGDALLLWFREGANALVETLGSTDPDTPVWTWASAHTAAFWFRRMAEETSVHRWDAERATGTPAPIRTDLAADGVDELLDLFLPMVRPEPERPAGRIHLRAVDLDRAWAIAMDAPDATAEGTASHLLLFLWNRIGPGELDVTGNEATLDRWRADVRIE